MKQCPECNRTYADQTLTFCLSDGALLSASYDPNATQLNPTIPTTDPPPIMVLPPDQSRSQLAKRRGIPRSIYAVIVLMAILIVSLVGFIIITRYSNKSTSKVESTPEAPGTPKTPDGWKVVALGVVPVNQAWTPIGRYQGKILILMWGEATFPNTSGTIGPEGWPQKPTSSVQLPGASVYSSLLKAGGQISEVGRYREVDLPLDPSGFGTDISLGPNDQPKFLSQNDPRSHWSYKICVPN